MPLLLLAIAVVFGFVGVAIAENKGVDRAAGFCLGALLGPFGLILVALLNPATSTREARSEARSEPHSDSEEFAGCPTLTNDAYRLWLGSHYNIQKNDVLGGFACDSKLFPSVDAALAHAHAEHLDEIAFRESSLTGKQLQSLRPNREGSKRWANLSHSLRSGRPRP